MRHLHEQKPVVESSVYYECVIKRSVRRSVPRNNQLLFLCLALTQDQEIHHQLFGSAFVVVVVVVCAYWTGHTHCDITIC